MPRLEVLEIRLSPSVARVRLDPEKLPLQEIARAVEGAGSKYGARLWARTAGPEPALTEALRAVKGVRSPGTPDKSGRRLITFDLKARTTLADLQRAARQAGGTLEEPQD